MPDDKKKTGGRDRARISMYLESEVRDWAAKFGVTKRQLRDAVRQAGDRATDVEAPRVRQLNAQVSDFIEGALETLPYNSASC
jgi:hypothetical protein